MFPGKHCRAVPLPVLLLVLSGSVLYEERKPLHDYDVRGVCLNSKRIRCFPCSSPHDGFEYVAGSHGTVPEREAGFAPAVFPGEHQQGSGNGALARNSFALLGTLAPRLSRHLSLSDEERGDE